MSFIGDRALERMKQALMLPEFEDGRYTVERELGRGGMGVVYLATDSQLGREVAIKVTRGAAADAVVEQRLRREAALVARLEHPGIVTVHDAGLLKDGRLYIVMKLVRGATLAEHLPLVPSLPQRLLLFERVCEPVAFAHGRGIVHRDLKPSNIMIGQFGEVLVLDWGLATMLGEAGGGSGTDGWMAPEQAAGVPLGPTADVYALGRLLGYMTEGFERDRRLQALIARAVAPRPEDRYEDATALVGDLRNYAMGRPVAAHRDSAFDRIALFAKTYRVAIVLIAAYLVMRVIIAVVFGR